MQNDKVLNYNGSTTFVGEYHFGYATLERSCPSLFSSHPGISVTNIFLGRASKSKEAAPWERLIDRISTPPDSICRGLLCAGSIAAVIEMRAAAVWIDEAFELLS